MKGKGRLWAWVGGTVAVSLAGFLAVILLGWAPLLGLDLQGGLSVVYKPAHTVKAATINETIDIIRNRVDALGVSEPNIFSSGGDITVELPGVKNRAQALSIIGQTAELYFRQVTCPPPDTDSSDQYAIGVVPVYSKKVPKGKSTPTLTGAPPACTTTENFADVPSTPSSLDTKKASVLLPMAKVDGAVPGRYILGPELATGNIVKTATAELNSTTSTWEVDMTFTSKGSSQWDTIAKETFHQALGIVLDGVVESAPVIQPTQASFTSFGGQAQITGSFTQTEADNLALELRYGALPVQLVQQNVDSVSPTLGKASLVAGIFAAIVGLALVFAYTVWYYRGLGIVVLLGLATTAALLWAIISYLGHSPVALTLDLTGITGLIVSVGIVADSYIVFFERLKDEVRAGKSVGASVDKGFASAFRTIIAADLVSLIGAVVLYIFSVSEVKGFAFYLGLSTLLDMVTAWTFTRPLVMLLGRSRFFTEAPFIGVARGLARQDRAGGSSRWRRSRGRHSGGAIPEAAQ